MELSVVIITKDEEVNIQTCLESVNWASEIVIVDSGSKDRTLEICKRYTDRIFEIKWEGYGKNKNFGLEQAKSEWVFSIDADEQVSIELKEQILTVLSSEKIEFDGFYIPRRFYFLGRWLKFGGCYPDYQLRLFRRGKGYFTSELLHESVKLDGCAGYLKFPIKHYSYSSIKEYFERFNLYTSLGAQRWYERGKKFSLFSFFRLPIEFIYLGFIRLGFLDGYRGLFYALFSSFSSFVKYVKLWEIEKRKK